MENTYNKVQYSEFTDNGKLNGNGQWVIRTETYTEAMAILEQIRRGTPGSTMPATVVTPMSQNTPFVPQAPQSYSAGSQSVSAYSATPKQVNAIYKMSKHAGISLEALGKQFGFNSVEGIDKKIASNTIDYLMNLK